MINKGELYMEFENTDEAIRRQACEKVKQIVKAIKAIRIKYYLNFAKISDKDQETYQKLEANLEELATSHNLNKLKVELMQEISDKYDRKDEDIQPENGGKPDKFLQACYGAIDAQKEALSHGKITQARKCQQILKQYMQKIDLDNYNELIINYKREKFAELMKSRDELENKNDEWNKIMRAFYKEDHVSERQKVIDSIINIPEKTLETKSALKDEIEML